MTHLEGLTPDNPEEVFAYWESQVLLPGNSLTPSEKVSAFLRCLSNPESTFGGNPQVDPGRNGALVQHLERMEGGTELVISMKDRLTEVQTRKRRGAFFTPELFSKEARGEISKAIGESWESQCVVWDNSAGTANLTKGHEDWGCLISSTIDDSDVSIMKNMGIGGDHVFQYDFLNPESSSEVFGNGYNTIPPEVEEALKDAARSGKRLVFFMNPPYGTAGGGRPGSVHKVGVASSTVNKSMRPFKFGAATHQSYIQFMFRCQRVAEAYGFVNHTVALFSNPKFMSAMSYKNFRDWWYGRYEYQSGFMTRDSNMSDTSGRWGSCFTVWNSLPKIRSGPYPLVTMRLVDVKSGSVSPIGVKRVYTTEGREAVEWFKAPVKGMKGEDAPQMTSGLITKTKGKTMKGKMIPGSFYYFTAKGNSVMGSGEMTFMTSSCFASAFGGCSVVPANWHRVVSMYAARKLNRGNWINDSDEFFVPDESHPDYKQWVDDSHLYTLLHPSNNCTAMRGVQHKGKHWHIKNHWFWRTRQSAMELLDSDSSRSVYEDCRREPVKGSSTNILTGEDETHPWEKTGDPYFSLMVSTGEVKFSPDAQALFDLLDALWIKSVPFREGYYANRPVAHRKPDLHLNSWDAGVYQMKYLWRDLFPNDWEEIREAYKSLAERLRVGVYKFGFLRDWKKD